MRCHGYKRNGNRCKIAWNLNGLGYCTHHERQGLPSCQGFYLSGDGERSTNIAKQNYDFCCAAHDPALPYIAPSIMDPIDFYLRPRVESDVVARYDGKDIYNRESVEWNTPVELDHILEKQCFTYAMTQMGLRRGDDDFATAVDMLRDSCVNELDNLAFTRRSTNRIKGEGVWKYLDDSLTGHLGKKNFTSYLQDATWRSESLTRDVTRRICRSMGRSTRRAQRKLSDEGETPVLEQLSEQLQQLYVDMELNVRR
ncbi:Hypothetical protein PHPALM_4557 [Phytophthora palmivora]|uniref:Uncharacterized protein n=1 Tax=Phytophthora palmivora TaxID=4796 RepID=A0A2P4YJL3_9STRA|nr:Hypothetical protein PHPALM_4557 [Phytophthora palmivora]